MRACQHVLYLLEDVHGFTIQGFGGKNIFLIFLPVNFYLMGIILFLFTLQCLKVFQTNQVDYVMVKQVSDKNLFLTKFWSVL